MSRTNELRLITRVAQMYYVDRLKQSDISQRLHISQATISRLLKRAEDESIVRITINAPRGTYVDLETGLRERFGLTEAIVAECGEDREESILAGIGDAAAHFLETTLDPGEVIGISSWSASLLRMVDAINPLKRITAERVVQMLGGMGNPAVQGHATHLTTRLAQLTGSQPQLLPAPGVAGSASAKRALLADPYVRATIEQWRRITLALVGIGAVEPSKMLANSGNVFTGEELEAVAQAGGVGDICLRFFGAYGAPVQTPLDERVISMSLDEIGTVPRIVGVAGGARKVAAIRGALLGRHINTLITDRFTAEKLLAQSDNDFAR
ncbi:DNA-binding transcriptional regulator LsrR (DeoR family) [Inquilinus ginsengisoli]|uniref:sugar-binding transcriptional regulator n=1 Tax=Inquilinus ginsengisoli TaxID=363840 RepID=UPI003D19BEE4